ncbi:MAG: hypothetical protein Q4A36_02420 [Candidatus Saccharibacteria bacterium]|nr:hypothetical protein [Candidatus Saccharibacteria bacterium]
MDFLEKINENPFKDLYWNVPDEQKKGELAIIGGNEKNFRTSIKVSEFVTANFPLKEIRTALPDRLRNKLPSLPNFVFFKTTEVGTFSDPDEIKNLIESVDFSLIIGDLSKNSVTSKALLDALQNSEEPVLITRDAVDLIAEIKKESLMMRTELIIMASVVQWQKILHNLYYPKILQPSQSLIQVAESFHKFTLSYPVQVVTLHEGQIIIAKNGRVVVVALEKSGYAPLTFWNGELAAKIAAMNIFNPNQFIEATVAALFR